MAELGTRCTTERVQVGNSPPTVARAVFLSQPRTGWVSSRETLISGRRPCGQKGKATSFVAPSRAANKPGVVAGTRARQETPCTRTGRPRRRLPPRAGRWGKAQALRPTRTSPRSRSGTPYRRIRTKTGNRRRRVRREDPAPSRTSDSRARSAPSSGPPCPWGGRACGKPHDGRQRGSSLRCGISSRWSFCAAAFTPSRGKRRRESTG